MPNIIGEEIASYVAKQINARQTLHGSGTGGNFRNNDQLVVLNSNTSWIKFSSGVSLTEEKIKDLGLDASNVGTNLAQRNILFGGTSTLNGTTLIQKNGFLDGTYEASDFGIVPMPGIISANIQTLTRGSIKKATIKFKVHNRRQFEIVDTLYLRLGYTVLLEWGNNIFTPDGTTKSNVLSTLTEDSDGFFSNTYQNNASHRTFLGKIETYRAKYRGNYDGVLGKITNFNWTFNEDGSYDIEVNLHSLGDVIESLKTNVPVNSEFEEFIKATDPSYKSEETPDAIEENRSKSFLHFNLWLIRWFNRNSDLSNKITMTTPDGSTRNLGSFSDPLGNGNTSLVTKTYKFEGTIVHIDNDTGDPTLTKVERIVNQDEYDKGPWKIIQTIYQDDQGHGENWHAGGPSYGGDEDDENELINQSYNLGQYTVTEVSSITISNPFTGFTSSDVFKLHTNPFNYYMRFGALLKIIKEKILPRIGKADGEQIVNIDNFSATMYTLPNQISLDPNVCIVKNNVVLPQGEGTISYFNELLPFTSTSSPSSIPIPPSPANSTTSVNEANPMNIYINFNHIINSLNNNQDEKGDIQVFNFLASLCTDINKALGGINNLEPVINELSNTLYIIDSTPLPGRVSQGGNYVLNLYGYKGTESNFIRKLDIKTAITPEYATMVTVGATAGGYTQGVEATAFSKWNKGIIDRFKEEIIAPTQNNIQIGLPDIVKSYMEKFLYGKSNQLGYGNKDDYPINNNEGDIIEQDIVDQNLSIVPEFYKYAMSKKTIISPGDGMSGGTIGFIPFKISFTMDGLSGIKIYNVLHIDSSFLPKVYGRSLDFIVTGVEHNLQKDDWETTLTVNVMPKSLTSSGAGSGVLLPSAQSDNSIPNYEFIYEQGNLGNLIQQFKNLVTGDKQEDKAPVNNNKPNENRNDVGTRKSGESERSVANRIYAAPYGLNIKTATDAQQPAFKNLQKKLTLPIPQFYSGQPIPNQQKTTDGTPVKLSTLTFIKNIDTGKSLTQWKDSSGKKVTIQLRNAKGKSNEYFVVEPKMHKDAIPSFQKAFGELIAHYGIEKIYDLGLNCTSGAYVPKGGTVPSMHSFGIAIDILSSYGLNKSYPSWKPGDKTPELLQPQYKQYIQIMRNNGWYCGFRGRRDLMHLQKIDSGGIDPNNPK